MHSHRSAVGRAPLLDAMRKIAGEHVRVAIVAGLLALTACGPMQDPKSWRAEWYESESKSDLLKRSIATWNTSLEEKITYEALLIFAEARATTDLDTRGYLSLLKNYTLPADRDTVDAMLSLILQDMDNLAGPPNEFVTETVPARAAWVAGYGGYHPGRERPLDAMGMAVIQLGVPEIRARGLRILTLFFPPSNQELTFFEDDYGEHIIVPSNLACARITAPSPHKMAESQREQMEHVHGKVITETDWELLKNVTINATYFPAAQASFDPLQPWNSFGVSIDLYMDMKSIAREVVGSQFIDFSLRYVLSDALSGEILKQDLQQKSQDITGTDRDASFRTRVFVHPVHERTGKEGSRIYQLAVQLASGERKLTRTFSFSLPTDTLSTPYYPLELVAPDQHNNQFPLPFFLPPQELERGKNYRLWVPLQNFEDSNDVYEGIVDIFLEKQRSTEGTVTLSGFETVAFGDSLTPTRKVGDSQVRNYTRPPVHSEFVRAATPNSYGAVAFTIPDDVDLRGGRDFNIIAFVYSRDGHGNVKEVVQGSMAVRIK